MERNPALLLEGIALAGYAVGADARLRLVRSEYPRSKPALDAAVRRARAHGHLGDDILGERLLLRRPVVEGAGSYVVGEETALLNWLQGLRGDVSARPPFPAERGYHGLPTVVNNVETLCNVPFIARTAPRRTARSAPARRPARSSSASTSASCARASTRSASGRRCARSARSSAAGCATGRRSRRSRSGGRSAGSSRPRARHRRSTSTSSPREGCMVGHGGDRRLRRPHGHARARAAPPRLRRARELRQVLPVPDRAHAGARDARRADAPVDRALLEELLETLEVGEPLRARRRHAGADPQPARALAGRAGARLMDVAIDGIAVEVEARRDGARRRRARRPLGADALLRRPDGALRRLPRLPRRRRGRARAVPRARRLCRDGMVVETRGARAADRAERRRARPLRATRAARPSTPSSRPSRASSASVSRAGPARRTSPPRRRAIPISCSSTSCASRAAAACARATRSRARSR